MECRKYQEHITAAVDDALEHHEQKELDAHLAQCPRCRDEFEYEKLTRSVVKSRCRRKPAPQHVMAQISQRLDEERIQPQQKSSWWKNLFVSPFARPAVGFALAAIAVVVVVKTNDNINTPRVIQASSLPANDIIKQSLENYLLVASGKIKPTMPSKNASEVQNYFRGKTEFPVVIPASADGELVGGVLNEFGGKSLAHVVYNHRMKEMIYVYEACWQTVQGGQPLHLAKDIQDELNATGWYSTTAPDGRTLVMWTNGTTLCSAVSMLDESTLKDFLTAK